MKSFEKEIRAYALKNALEFGKADAAKILPKLFQHGLKKENIKDNIPEIKKIVDEINTLPIDEKKLLFANYEGVVKVHEEKERALPDLPNIKKNKKVVLRTAPFPSGALHLGNAKTFLLNSLYAEKYKGKLLLVMDDTIGSEKKQVNKESYKLIEDAFKWLGIKHQGKIIYKSDRLKTYYRYAEQLIKKDKAYVCYCSQKELKKNREDGRECGCRLLPVKIHLKRWKEMFKLIEGEATLRIKTDMMHPNPAFRDRVLFKISDREHPRVGKKYKVWPTLEMSWAIDDHLLRISHIIRGNDLMMESDMEKCIWDIFKWIHPEIIHTGLVQIEGTKISKSKAQEEVKSGKFMGWDDPRTWSIQSLARRGIKPEAVREFVKEIGLNKQDITVPINNLYAINRKLIDSKAKRYSFVIDPIKLNIKNKPNWENVSIPIHPNNDEKRRVKLGDIFISGDDYKKFKGKEVRLLHLFNIVLNVKSKLSSIDIIDIPKLNWVSDYVLCRVLMLDGNWIKGIADSGIENLGIGEVIQFERNFFCRFDSKIKLDEKDIFEFWFAHM